MLQKANQPKHGGHKTILERWRKDDRYRNYLTSGGWTEEHIKEYDAIALQKQTHVASRTEGRRISQNWVLKDNRQGAQQIPRDQQPDFAQATKITKRLHDEHLKETQADVRSPETSKSFCQSRGQEFQGLEKFNFRVDPKIRWRCARVFRQTLDATKSVDRTRMEGLEFTE